MRRLYNKVKKWYNIDASGYVALISVLVVSAVGIGIVLSLLTLGIGISQTSSDIVESARSRSFADACAEDALMNATSNTTTSWSGGISFEGGSCSYQVSNNGSDGVVDIQATATENIRKIKILFQTNSSTISLNSWKEVSDF